MALFPPTFRRSVGADLRRLLIDSARARRGAGRAWFVVINTLRAVRDAGAEWLAVIAEVWTTTRRGLMWGSGIYGLRLTLKGLLRRPGYSLPVLITLTLGIGANTAMFTVLNSVVLRPLPYPEADRIVRVAPAPTAQSEMAASFSLPDIRDWEERSTTVASLGGFTTLHSDLVVVASGEAVEVETAYVTPGLFGALGVQPEIGRLPTTEDERTDPRVVVVSHAFWSQYLEADRARVGRTVSLSDEEYVVVGVMPPGFAFPMDGIEVWALLAIIEPTSTPYHIRAVRLLDAVARMADGASIEQVRADLGSVAAGLAAEFPDSNERVPAAAVRPLQDEVVGDARLALFVLMAAAGLILVITWANLANLALAREAGRASELAVRAALGASRARRMGLVLAESLVLSLAAGALGLATAVGATDALVALGGSVLPRVHEISPDWRVAAFTLAASLVTAVSVALLASARAGRADLADSVRASGRGMVERAGKGFLIVSQVSLSVVLLVGATLLIRSLSSLDRVDPGFETEGLVVAEMTFASTRFPDRTTFLPRFDATREALEAVPGVRSVSSIRRFPFRGSGEGFRWTLPGDPEDAEGTRANLLQVGPGLFETMGIPLLEGPGFTPDDRTSGRWVVVVSQSVARAAFPDGRAVGQRLLAGGLELEVVGVVGDIRQSDLRSDPSGVVYVLNDTNARRGGAFVIRTEPGVSDVLPSIRAAVRRLDPQQPITELAPAERIVGEELGRDRFMTLLLVLFAGLALSLSAVGVYAVVAFGVSRRRREVGIRLALGAEPSGVRALVVRQGMRPVAVGIVAGVLLTLVATGALERMLHGVGRFDPLAYLGTVTALSAIAFAACWLPARSAASDSAVEALAAD